MKKILSLVLVIVLTTVIFAACGGSKDASSVGADAEKSAKVAVICKAMDSEFWKDVERGALDAGKELGITVDVKAPDKESNVEQQMKIIEDAILQKYDVIAVAPTDSEGIVPIMEDAATSGTKIITVDTDADTDAKLAFVGTNNTLGGKMAADRISEIVGDNKDAKIAMITGVPGQQTMRDRITGFKDGLEEHGLTLIEEQPADSDPGKAMNVMENLLTSYPDLDAVFILNATMSVSSLEAIANAKSDVKVIGFDSSTDALVAVEDGRMDALIAQSPYQMGYLAVTNAKKVIDGETIDAIIDTGTELVTAENVDKYIK